jgi:hypothetical protein
MTRGSLFVHVGCDFETAQPYFLQSEREAEPDSGTPI